MIVSIAFCHAYVLVFVFHFILYAFIFDLWYIIYDTMNINYHCIHFTSML